MGDEDLKGITVAVRVRPLNQRELNEGHRVCTHFDEETGQVALTAVDRNTLLQLKGATARGYAFDRRYGMDDTSDKIFSDCVEALVNNVFKGYNGTVLAYGQTGSGKTHTMSGGVGHYGVKERGVTPRVIDHVFAHVAAIQKRLKPGEKIEVSASAVEIYNEEFRDLSKSHTLSGQRSGWDSVRSSGQAKELKLQEIPTGQGNRVRAEVVGLAEHICPTAADLNLFFEQCFDNRITSSTKLNDTSSRSHALFTINVRRVVVTVGDGVDRHLKAMVRTEGIESKLHLVDLAGSERVKRSGAKGKQFREATNINSGLLALGNVIVALAERQMHIPYRDSKLTRLVQDSLGGNSLTVLITCISPSEADFEETNNTLKYANRACSIQNVPLPNRFLMMEEDLLPAAPGMPGDVKGVVSIEALLAENMKQKELRERRTKEREEKERLRREALSVKKEQLMKTKGYQRLLAQEYDRKLKEARMKGKRRFNVHETVDGRQIEHSANSGQATGASLGRDASTASIASSSNYQMPEPSAVSSATDHMDAGVSPAAVTPATGDTAASAPAPKNLSPALARAMARRQQARQALGAATPSPAGPGAEDVRTPAPAAHAPAASLHTPEAMRRDQVMADEEEDYSEDVPLAAEEEAQVRQAAERAALEKAAAEAGEALEDVSVAEDDELTTGSGGALDDGDGDGEEDAGVRVLARFKVNKMDCVSVFKATTKEDFKDVVKLLPENTPLPASNKMTYLIARLELHPAVSIQERLALVNEQGAPMADAVGPAVGCLMATFGTNMISSCIFDFDDPEDLEEFAVEERIELWGLQIPHNAMRPVLKEVDPEALKDDGGEAEEQTVAWSSVDRLNMSVGLLYALCVNATDSDVSCGFCVPRSQLLKRWQGAGVRMKEVTTKMRLIYPPHAHDFEYYKSSTVAFFLVDEVQDGLRKKLALLE